MSPRLASTLIIVLAVLGLALLLLFPASRRATPLPAPTATFDAYFDPQMAKADREPIAVQPESPAPFEPPPPKAVLTERIAAPAAAPPKSHDAVCGQRGRTYYHRDNGYLYWRCNR
jgi:hypothetical protein